MEKQSFVKGAIILGVSSVLSKIIGAVYRIPLTTLLGAQGMGIYYIIFPVYAFIITFVSSSFTLSISRMISSSMANADEYMARRIFHASTILLFFFSSILCVSLLIGARLISSLQGFENAYSCYFAIAPAIILVALGSSFKGFFQGMQNMTPSAVSQIVEQIVKLSCGFTLASILSRHGTMHATVGALIGITISEGVSVLFFVIWYLIYRKRNIVTFKGSKHIAIIPLAGKIFKNTLPFLLTSVIAPLSLLIDSFLIVNLLKSIGFDKYFATALLGLNGGVVSTLISLPTTLSSSICITLIPSITYALSRGDINSISKKSVLAFKITFIIAIPCAIAFLLFSSDIVSLLYSGGMSEAQMSVAVSMLSLASINVIYVSLFQISTALLQALSKAYLPVMSLSVALIFKVILEVMLVSNMYINIFGAVISASICYAISTVINIIYLRRHLRLSIGVVRSFISPLLSGALMGVVIYLSMVILSSGMSYHLSIICSFLSGVIIYLLMIFALRTFTREERRELFKLRKPKTI